MLATAALALPIDTPPAPLTDFSGKVTRRTTDSNGKTTIVVDPTPGAPNSGDEHELWFNNPASPWHKYIDDSFDSPPTAPITVSGKYEDDNPQGDSNNGKAVELGNP